MSFQISDAKASEPNLLSLPLDVIFAILENLSPLELASFSQVSSTARHLISHPRIWHAAAARHLADFSVKPSSLAEFYSLARKLVCRWWLLTGAFVAGIPVHRRTGFADVRARGGWERSIHPNGAATCYVMGDPDIANLVISKPAVHLSFFLNSDGPYPVDGMRITLVHAIENPILTSDVASHLAPHPSSPASEPPSASTSHVAPFSRMAPPLLALPGPQIASVHPPNLPVPYSQPIAQYFSYTAVSPTSASRQQGPVHLTIKVNNNTILSNYRPQGPHFSVLHLSVPQDVLLPKPRVNTLSIELNKYPNEAYWLKEVSISPFILPPPIFDSSSLIFPRNHSPPLRSELEEVPQSVRPPTENGCAAPCSPRASSRIPRRDQQPSQGVSRNNTDLISHRVDHYVHAQTKRPRHQTVPKTRRYQYHHNNYRSPRGSSNNSSKTR